MTELQSRLVKIYTNNPDISDTKAALKADCSRRMAATVRVWMGKGCADRGKRGGQVISLRQPIPAGKLAALKGKQRAIAEALTAHPDYSGKQIAQLTGSHKSYVDAVKKWANEGCNGKIALYIRSDSNPQIAKIEKFKPKHVKSK